MTLLLLGCLEQGLAPRFLVWLGALLTPREDTANEQSVVGGSISRTLTLKAGFCEYARAQAREIQPLV